MNKVYEIVTSQIIEALEEGTVAWQRGWVNSDHKNLASKKAYRGINPFLLNIATIKNGYKSTFWATYKQIKKLGGQVKKGEKSSVVTFFSWIVKKDKDGNEDAFPMLRYYRVFNSEQADFPDGFELPDIDALPDNFDPIAEADYLIEHMPNKPEIKHAGNRAFYSPRDDSVTMPSRESFMTTEDYYSVLFHELGHSTGHTTRLNRHQGTSHAFGSKDYSKEELVAEMTAAMICGILGIEQLIDNSAAYISSWLKALKDDKMMVIQAAGLAQKAADYIQGIAWKNGSLVEINK